MHTQRDSPVTRHQDSSQKERLQETKCVNTLVWDFQPLTVRNKFYCLSYPVGGIIHCDSSSTYSHPTTFNGRQFLSLLSSHLLLYYVLLLLLPIPNSKFCFPQVYSPITFYFHMLSSIPSPISYLFNLFLREPEILSKTVNLLKLCLSLENPTVDFICTILKHMYLHLDPEKITLVKVNYRLKQKKSIIK